MNKVKINSLMRKAVSLISPEVTVEEKVFKDIPINCQNPNCKSPRIEIGEEVLITGRAIYHKDGDCEKYARRIVKERAEQNGEEPCKGLIHPYKSAQSVVREFGNNFNY